MSAGILLIVPASGAESSCLAHGGVHDRVSVGKLWKPDSVDFTDASWGSPKDYVNGSDRPDPDESVAAVDRRVRRGKSVTEWIKRVHGLTKALKLRIITVL